MKTPTDISIGYKVAENIRRARIQAGFSQREVADEIGVVPQQISKYESAEDRISAAKLFLMAQMFTVQITDFFKGAQ